MVRRFTDAVIWKSRALLFFLFIFCTTEVILLLSDTPLKQSLNFV